MTWSFSNLEQVVSVAETQPKLHLPDQSQSYYECSDGHIGHFVSHWQKKRENRYVLEGNYKQFI